MPGDREQVRRLLDATAAVLDETREAYDQQFPPLVLPARVVKVAVGDDVQAALDHARTQGGILQLAVGEHRCNLRVEADPSAQPVLLTSDTANVPAEGERITRDYLPGLAQLRSANNVDPVLAYRCGSTGVHLTGIATLPQQYDRTVIAFGTDQMTTPDEQPHDIVHDRVLMVGDPERGQHRGIQAHVRRYSLLNSSLLDFHEEGRDSTAVAAWNGGQDLLIRNCCLEAGAYSIMLGGGNARSPEMVPARILLEDCRLTKNPLWVSGMEYQPNIKCLLEIKHARQVTVRCNVFEHCWPESWSTGVAIVIKSCDQSGTEPWTRTEDIVIEHNVIRKVGAGFSIVGGHDDGKPTELLRRLRIAHNLLHDLDVQEWQGKGAAFMVSNLPDDLVIDHNTIVHNGWGVLDLTYNQPEKGLGFTLINSAVWQGNYGIKTASGTDYAAWTADMGYAPTVEGIALRYDADRSPDWGPGTTRLSEVAFDGSFAADYTLTPGSPVASVGTTDGQLIGADIAALPKA